MRDVRHGRSPRIGPRSAGLARDFLQSAAGHCHPARGTETSVVQREPPSAAGLPTANLALAEASDPVTGTPPTTGPSRASFVLLQVHLEGALRQPPSTSTRTGARHRGAGDVRRGRSADRTSDESTRQGEPRTDRGFGCGTRGSDCSGAALRVQRNGSETWEIVGAVSAREARAHGESADSSPARPGETGSRPAAFK